MFVDSIKWCRKSIILIIIFGYWGINLLLFFFSCYILYIVFVNVDLYDWVLVDLLYFMENCILKLFYYIRVVLKLNFKLLYRKNIYR